MQGFSVILADLLVPTGYVLDPRLPEIVLVSTLIDLFR